jgi:two-component sensor histidine kinase
VTRPLSPPSRWGPWVLLRSVRGRMLLLLIVASVPVIGIAGANAILGYQSERASGLRTVTLLGEVAAERHGAALSGMRELLQGVATSAVLTDASSPRCQERMDALLGIHRQRYSNIWLLDGEGRILCSGLPTDIAQGNQEYVALARDAARNATPGGPPPFVINRFKTGTLTSRPVLTGFVPVMRDGKVEMIVAAGLLLDVFIRKESQSMAVTPDHVWLMDRQNAPLPLTGAKETDLPATPLMDKLLDLRANQALEGFSRTGSHFAYAISDLEQGLRLVVGLPTVDIRANARTLLLRRALELAVFLLACLIVIVVGADIAIARPLRLLASRVRDWRPGVPFPGQPSRGEPEEVRALEQAFNDAAIAIAAREEQLNGALRQRDLLMAEIHHRVKNNLQIVASLLNLQAGRLRDPAARAEFSTARDRVQALATLHRHLYTNRTFEAIALRPFLEELSKQLFNALGEIPDRRIRLLVEAEDMEIVTDQAVSMALLVTEAVTNSIKHAFPDTRTGTITIAVRHDGVMVPEGEDEEFEAVILVVHDDGLGLGPREEEQGIGMRLIQGFAQHLGGEMERQATPEAGTELRVRFPLRRRESDLTGRPMGTPGD